MARLGLSMPVPAAVVATFMELPVTFAVAIRASFGFTYVFLHAEALRLLGIAIGQ
jgi:hypothetical protein